MEQIEQKMKDIKTRLNSLYVSVSNLKVQCIRAKNDHAATVLENVEHELYNTLFELQQYKQHGTH